MTGEIKAMLDSVPNVKRDYKEDWKDNNVLKVDWRIDWGVQSGSGLQNASVVMPDFSVGAAYWVTEPILAGRENSPERDYVRVIATSNPEAIDIGQPFSWDGVHTVGAGDGLVDVGRSIHSDFLGEVIYFMVVVFNESFDQVVEMQSPFFTSEIIGVENENRPPVHYFLNEINIVVDESEWYVTRSSDMDFNTHADSPVVITFEWFVNNVYMGASTPWDQRYVSKSTLATAVDAGDSVHVEVTVDNGHGTLNLVTAPYVAQADDLIE